MGGGRAQGSVNESLIIRGQGIIHSMEAINWKVLLWCVRLVPILLTARAKDETIGYIRLI